MKKSPLISIGLFVLLSCGLLGGLLLQRLTDSDHINEVAHRMADFDLPPGYQTDFAVDIGDYTFATYKSADEQSHLAFVKVPDGVIPDDDVIEGHVYGGWSRHSQRHATVLSTEERIVCGQPATLTISERINGEGRLYRSAYLVFEGHDGTAVLVINQPATVWNRDLVDRFIASIQ